LIERHGANSRRTPLGRKRTKEVEQADERRAWSRTEIEAMKRSAGEPTRIRAKPLAERYSDLGQIDGQVVVEIGASQRRRPGIGAVPLREPEEKVGELSYRARHLRRIRLGAGDSVDDLLEVFGKVINFHDSAT